LFNLKKIIIFFLFLHIGLTQSDFSGNANFSYAIKINEFRVLNLPYRLLELRYIHEKDNFAINTEFAFEWNRKNDIDFLVDNNPQDFILDLREMYLTWFIDFGEIKIGKQFQSWGFVDNNSPLDNINGLDYYYLFEGDVSRKIGSYSLVSNIYLNNINLQMFFSPFHNSSRMPIVNGAIDKEFPDIIPIVPERNEVINIKNPKEYGISLKNSFESFDLAFSYFSGFDRIFNFAGVNVYGNGPDISFPHTDVYYGFRKTNVFGLSSLFILNNLILRSDFGLFSTKDINKISNDLQVGDLAYENPNLYDSLHFVYKGNEESNYIQTTLQFEYSLSNNIEFIGQLFYYHNNNYSSDEFPEIPDIPNIPTELNDINPELLFKPGMGSALSVLTEKALLFNVKKSALDNQLKINFGTLLDFTSKPNGNYDTNEEFTDLNFNGIWDNDEKFKDINQNILRLYGGLVTFGLDYHLSDNVMIKSNLTKIIGSNYYSKDANYQFNLMKTISNFKFDIVYYF
jgi:hypothetical protein|tara:strand:- start:5787 stop:7322 length:1536 start_codon:yes stop_codon:yes gene_type:complete